MTEQVLTQQEGGWRLWLHSLKVAQLLRSVASLHTNQFRSYLDHLVQYKQKADINYYMFRHLLSSHISVLSPFLKIYELKLFINVQMKQIPYKCS